MGEEMVYDVIWCNIATHLGHLRRWESILNQ